MNQFDCLETDKSSAGAKALTIVIGFGCSYISTDKCVLSSSVGHSAAKCGQYRIVKRQPNEGRKHENAGAAAIKSWQ